MSAVAKSVLSQVAKELAAPAVKGVKARVLGDPEQQALERALRRAFAEVEGSHGRRLADFDVNIGFWEHEGAPELAKVLIPGQSPSAARLAERAVDSLGPSRSDDERLDRIIALRPALQALLKGLAEAVRREPALRAVLGLSDAADTAQATTRLAQHLGASAATDDDLVRYLRWLIDQHQYLPTTGVVRRTTVQLPLAEVFVGLRARVDRSPGDRAREWFEREREKLVAQLEAGQLDHVEFEAAVDRLEAQYGRRFRFDDGRDSAQVVPVLDAVRDTPRLLVLGDPGAGKTTVLRYLALTHARSFLNGTPVQGRPPMFPIYLRLGEYARYGHPSGIGEFLPHHLRQLECRTPGLSDLLTQQLEAGRCLVLLDGLDEIASAAQRQSVVTAVMNFVTAHARQGNRFVVTSRIAGYQAAPLPDSFQAVRLQDMDDPTIHRFLDVYCREVERAETPDKTSPAIVEAGAREAAAIRQALEANAGVRRLAANPLLLTALVLVHRASGRLPHRRVEAYIEVCNALGRTWRSVHGVAEADLPDERILHRWLAEVGAWLHEHRPEGAASKRELLAVLGPLWAKYDGSTWDPAVLEDADPLNTEAGRGVVDFVEKVDAHTGLLVERAPGRYGFVHQTFEEYYTGRALAFRGSDADRITAIRSRLHDPRYEEPILLALGLIGTDYAEQIDEVVAHAIWPARDNPSPYEEILGRDFLFMLRVLADDIPLERTATIDTILNQAIDEYLNPDMSRCRFRAYQQALTERLAGLGATKAGERFRSAIDARIPQLTQDQLAPWCQLAGIAARLGPLASTTITTLAELATGDADPWVRALAVMALAAEDRLSDSVVDVLVRLATGDADPWVRVQAVRVLAAEDRLSDSVVDVLVRLATGDADPRVRVQAVMALAEGGGLSDSVVEAAVRLATGDADPEVRVLAVMVLAEGGWLSELGGTAGKTIAGGESQWVGQSRHALSIDSAIESLMAALLDGNDSVGRAAASTLSDISNRYPDRATEIQERLATACTSPDFGKKNRFGGTAWDYAYEALQQQTRPSVSRTG